MTNGGVDSVDRYTYDSVAHMGRVFYEQSYPIIVMNAAEVYLIRAEAALRGLSGEDAAEMYRKGIEASMLQWNVDPGDVATYLSSPAAALTGGETEENLENIAVQKYLAIIFEGREAWAEFRRTGYPKIWTGINLGSTTGEIPKTTYPLSEYNLNSSNLSAAVQRLDGKDLMMSKMWWDAKPGLPFHHQNQGVYPPEVYW